MPALEQQQARSVSERMHEQEHGRHHEVQPQGGTDVLVRVSRPKAASVPALRPLYPGGPPTHTGRQRRSVWASPVMALRAKGRTAATECCLRYGRASANLDRPDADF